MKVLGRLAPGRARILIVQISAQTRTAKDALINFYVATCNTAAMLVLQKLFKASMRFGFAQLPFKGAAIITKFHNFFFRTDRNMIAAYPLQCPEGWPYPAITHQANTAAQSSIEGSAGG